ncbi:Two-component system response regulator [Fulvivirga imtechensis AK7]|uniref:Two-component system response regulator n=1 Tax=Fulvivirga imtechensis AK7 TaxID=1237149 RepID=L8JYN7_9BACT|nr:LytTR family DNA-binding domain-containing protein [Fulvivirga imtechensis]ELR72312.1 Two-component system response regulator [Fulvivirga imtechensis AK7]
MKILVLEDESLAAEKLQNLIKEVDPAIEIAGILKSVEGAVDWFSTHEHPDLIFSDIRLLDGLSFEIFKKVEINKPVIFTTAYDQYAIKAFEINSIDYLLKPVQKEKLALAIGKFKRVAQTEQPVAYDQLLQMLESRKVYKSRFMIRNGHKILAVPVDKVAYFFSQNKLTYLVTTDEKKYAYDQPLEVIDQQLDPKIFYRANRKYIVRFEAIREIHPHFKGRIKINLKPEADDEIVISADKTPEFKSWLDQ